MTRSTPRPEVDLVGLHRCTTCQRVARELEAAGVHVRAFRDLREEKADRRELLSWAARVGGPSHLFSKRAMKYRELGLDRRELSEGEMIENMLAEPTLITRPLVLLVGSPLAVCGTSPKSMREFLARVREGWRRDKQRMTTSVILEGAGQLRW